MWPFFVLVFLDGSLATPNESNIVEHQVTSEMAHATLSKVNVSDLMGEGCKTCTQQQTGYCLSEDLVMDHCFCDHRHKERLGYMQHTCYVPNRFHPTFATDCLEYVRVLECCCHAVLLPRLKEEASNGLTSVHLASPTWLLPVVIALRHTSALDPSTA
ncbi:uncharacterized protein LOC128983482 isoform X2 [Macrosteles quadrilineatus]|uniref:uncharacterized protein LOC128983482 isoform X2 n=1 Tax=Macrosteles quadrilineatus TaxID=74068 RepID=UPI0023E0D06D|nr:uncharacterized protein LOC128983482 isoform X2 [Macrosteles quadrilineatus]